MNHSPADGSSSAAARTTRSTPSAPRPRRRSHSAATLAPVSSRRPAGSGSSTKSFCVPCPLRNSIPPIGTRLLGHSVEDACGQVVESPVEPLDPAIAPEPGPLPPDEPSRRLCGRRRGGLEVAFAVQLRDHLLVAERARRRLALAQPTRQQHLDLVDETG